MKNKQLITIPLVSLSNDQKRWESGREWEEKIFDNKNYIKILALRELPNFSYGIEVKDPSMVTYFGRNTIVIFSKSDFPAQDNIFLVGLKHEHKIGPGSHPADEISITGSFLESDRPMWVG